jgi:hypothetical protein
MDNLCILGQSSLVTESVYGVSATLTVDDREQKPLARFGVDTPLHHRTLHKQTSTVGLLKAHQRCVN